MHRDVQRDVVAAREIVEGDGRHTEHDDAVEHALEELEHIAVEARSVGEGVVSLMALHIKDIVGEVVILVNDKIEL